MMGLFLGMMEPSYMEAADGTFSSEFQFTWPQLDALEATVKDVEKRVIVT